MITTTPTGRRAAVALAVLAAVAGSAATADASSAVEARGTCSAGAEWKLKGKHDDGRIEVEFEVDSNVVGQVWSVRLTDNGIQRFQGTRTTLAPSGSFTVRRRIVDLAGGDTVRVVATDTASGQRCAGSITV
jgi:hypothetical protein